MLTSHHHDHFQRPLTCLLSGLVLSALLAACGTGDTNGEGATAQASVTPADSESNVGERLFLETRFSQAFKAYLATPGATVNDALPAGDPTLDQTQTTGAPLPGPFAGMTMNCRACHLVDEHVSTAGGSMRTYSDFARRSPIPDRADGKTAAPRNSPTLVNASLDHEGGSLFHFDGEFNSVEDLVAGTFTGRNFGWLPWQRAEAIAHIARVAREDDGKGPIAQLFDGLPYRILLSGVASSIPDDFRLQTSYRTFMGSASDQEIFDGIVRLVAAYVTQLQFSQSDDAGNPIRSPFDVFLEMNGLPQRPDPNESDLAYSRRLRILVNNLSNPQFVGSNPNTSTGQFIFHPQQTFQFQTAELEGLKMFLAEPAALAASQTELTNGTIGNCIACHAAPNFTDFKLHNTGTTQKEYDAIHGIGQFAAVTQPLTVLTATARNASYNTYLPATENHPAALEPFRGIPSAGTPGVTDLGVWNIFANPDMPGPQAKIRALLCEEQAVPCPGDDVLLPAAIARFKTPGLRDLSHSAPYMHNGQFDTLDDIIEFYRASSDQARSGTLRNGAAQLKGIALKPADVAPLVAFLKSLNEDYQ